MTTLILYPFMTTSDWANIKNNLDVLKLYILIRFNRAIDVSLLLSKTRFLPSGIWIKPVMTPEEQLIESILLKERWGLIQKESN